jgi:hypothetical protein
MRSLLLLLLCAGLVAAQTPTPTPIPNLPPAIFVDILPDPILDGAWVVCSPKDAQLLRFSWTRSVAQGPALEPADWRELARCSFSIAGIYVYCATVNDGTNWVHDEVPVAATLAAADAAAKVK